MKFIGLLICCLCCFSGIAQEKETLKAGMKSADFSYQDVNGKTVSLKDLKGKLCILMCGLPGVCPAGENCLI